MVPSLIPYDLPFPQNGGSYAPKIREWPYLLSATGDLIHFMFGSRVGFSGSADRMTLFPVTSIPSWRPSCPPSWIISNGHSSATAHSIHLYSAHRAVIVAIAQLSCSDYVYVLQYYVHVCCVTVTTFFIFHRILTATEQNMYFDYAIHASLPKK